MDAMAEGQVPDVLPFDIERVRLLELSRIVVGRAQDHVDSIPPANRTPPDLNVAGGDTPCSLYRRVIPEELLYSVVDQLRVIAQSLQLVRMPKECKECLADEAAG